MAKTNILNIKVLFEKTKNIRKRYMDETGNQGMPYFKKIFEQLKQIDSLENIDNAKKIIEEIKNKSEKYKKFISIQHVCNSVINFLNNLQDITQLNKDEIDEFLIKIKLTNKDNSSLSNSESSLNNWSSSLTNNIENDITILDSEVDKQEQILENIDENIEIFKKELKVATEEKKLITNKIKQLEQELKKIIARKSDFQITLSNFKDKKSTLLEQYRSIDIIVNSNFLQLIQKARKWWHWPLKFLTCGVWESKAIKEIKKEYYSGELKKNKIAELAKELETIYSDFTNFSNQLDILNVDLKRKGDELLRCNNSLSSSVNTLDSSYNSSLETNSTSLPNIIL